MNDFVCVSRNSFNNFINFNTNFSVNSTNSAALVALLLINWTRISIIFLIHGIIEFMKRMHGSKAGGSCMPNIVSLRRTRNAISAFSIYDWLMSFMIFSLRLWKYSWVYWFHNCKTPGYNWMLSVWMDEIKKFELNKLGHLSCEINSLEMFGDRDAIVSKLMPLSLAVEFAGLDVAPIDLSIQQFRSVEASTAKCTEKCIWKN